MNPVNPGNPVRKGRALGGGEVLADAGGDDDWLFAGQVDLEGHRVLHRPVNGHIVPSGAGNEVGLFGHGERGALSVLGHREVVADRFANDSKSIISRDG